MVIPEAVVKYSPFGPVAFFTPAGKVACIACIVVPVVADGVVPVAVVLVMPVVVSVLLLADAGADLVVSDFIEPCDEVADSFAKTGPATKAANAAMINSFFIFFS